MKVCLIDADSVIPNLALMKISTYHKNKGDTVELFKANLPYFPNRKKRAFYKPFGYDKYYCSVVFDNNRRFISGKDIIFGGTGYDLTTNLPEEIKDLDPDYSLYPDNKISYGFLTRGCIRKCKFCVVPEKEGMIHQVNTIDNIVKHKVVKFLDNNFLALPNHKEILQELVDKKIKFQFSQGLDIRLLDEESSLLLSKANLKDGSCTFAFDDWSYLKLIEKKLPLLHWRKLHKIKFYVYASPGMELSNIINRIEWIRHFEFKPYLMRDITCWSSKYHDFFIDLASYCNSPNAIMKTDFEGYLINRQSNLKRRKISTNLYNNNITLKL